MAASMLLDIDALGFTRGSNPRLFTLVSCQTDIGLIIRRLECDRIIPLLLRG